MKHQPASLFRRRTTIRIENVKGLKLRDVTIEWSEAETEPAWVSALVLRNVSDFTVDSFPGRQGLRGKNIPAIVLENSSDGVVRNSSAAEGTDTFIHVTGDGTKDLEVKDNRTGKSKRAITFENEGVKKAV